MRTGGVTSATGPTIPINLRFEVVNCHHLAQVGNLMGMLNTSATTMIPAAADYEVIRHRGRRPGVRWATPHRSAAALATPCLPFFAIKTTRQRWRKMCRHPGQLRPLDEG
jgi:hypothetical protein